MSSSLTTIYLGHRISIEPFEWGYLAEVFEPTSGKHMVAASSSPFQALEDAFEIIDDSLEETSTDDEAPRQQAGG